MQDHSEILSGNSEQIVWLGNLRVPAETMQDLSDVEWLAALRGVYGERAISIGPPQAAVGKPACYWDERGMSGVYLDKHLICPPKQHNGQTPEAYSDK